MLIFKEFCVIASNLTWKNYNSQIILYDNQQVINFFIYFFVLYLYFSLSVCKSITVYLLLMNLLYWHTVCVYVYLYLNRIHHLSLVFFITLGYRFNLRVILRRKIIQTLPLQNSSIYGCQMDSLKETYRVLAIFYLRISLRRNDIEPFLKRLITGDEKCITYDNNVRKQL